MPISFILSDPKFHLSDLEDLVGADLILLLQFVFSAYYLADKYFNKNECHILLTLSNLVLSNQVAEES